MFEISSDAISMNQDELLETTMPISEVVEGTDGVVGVELVAVLF